MAMHLVLALVVVGVTLVPLLLEVWYNRFDFFNPKNPFLIYYALQFGASGIVTIVTGTLPGFGLDFSANQNSYLRAFALAAAGSIAFQLGYYTQRPRPFWMPRLLLLSWRQSRVCLLVACYSIVGLVSFLLLLRLNGGLLTFMVEREGWRAGGMTGQGFLLFPSTTLLAIAAHMCFIHTTRGPRKSPLHLAVSLLVYLVALVPAIMLGFRALIALPLLQALVLWQFRIGNIRLPRLGAALALLAAGFTAYGVIREVPVGMPVSAEQMRVVIQQRPDLLYSTVARTRGIEVLATVMERLAETRAYDFNGKSLIELVTIMIPSRLWQDKPTSSGERFSTYFFAGDFQYTRGSEAESFGGVSPTIVAEMYWHLGGIGALGFLYLMGRLAAVLYTTIRKHAASDSVLLFYTFCFTTFAMSAESVQGYANGFVLISLALLFTISILVVGSAASEPRARRERLVSAE